MDGNPGATADRLSRHGEAQSIAAQRCATNHRDQMISIPQMPNPHHDMTIILNSSKTNPLIAFSRNATAQQASQTSTASARESKANESILRSV
jgi:hypothetical protein